MITVVYHRPKHSTANEANQPGSDLRLGFLAEVEQKTRDQEAVLVAARAQLAAAQAAHALRTVASAAAPPLQPRPRLKQQAVV